MDVIVETHLKGTFNGLGKGKIFVLNKGFDKKWEQVDERIQSRYAYQPTVTLWRDGSAHYLEVEGMGDMVEVKKAR